MKLDDILLEYSFVLNSDTDKLLDALTSGEERELGNTMHELGHWEDAHNYLMKNFNFRVHHINPENIDWYDVAMELGFDDYRDEHEEMLNIADSDMDQFDQFDDFDADRF